MKINYDALKEKTEAVEKKANSKTVCLAKWFHSNIYFQTGETHSCYHPAPHAISSVAILKNPAALHNTEEKMQERVDMLAGKKPKGCQYCWNIESLGSTFLSDRHIRTGSLYTEEKAQEILNTKNLDKVVPDYIEISFGNECNFRCGYCHPKASSRYHNEIKTFGPYDMVKNHRCDIDWFKIYEEENNPYLTAWWQWWDQINDQLNILRITGGEPLIQKSTYRLLQNLLEKPKPNLELNINSNLGSAQGIVKKFCAAINDLETKKCIREFKLFTSIDTWGPQAEYIRNGLNLELFESNLKYYFENTNSPLALMITFNIFSVPNFKNLLKKILEWRAEYNWINNKHLHRLHFDISYLKEPLQYDIQILPKADFLPIMEDCLQFILENVNDDSQKAFSYMEYENFRRIVEYMKTSPYSEEKIIEGRKDFYNFFNEQDRRRGTNLLQNFTELTNFYEQCSVFKI